MKKLLYLSFVLVAFIATSAFTIFPINKIDLKLNLKKGDSYYVLMQTEQDIVQDMMGQQIKQKQTIIMGYDQTVVDVLSNGNYKIQITYKKMAYKNENDYGTVSFDSDDPESELSPEIKSMINSTYYFTCDNKGTVFDVEGIDEMIENMLNGMEFTSDQEREAHKESLYNQYGKEEMKSQLSFSLNFYPNEEVSIGDSWSKSIVMKTIMPLVIDNTWTLNSIQGNTAVINVDSKVSTPSDAEPTDINGMTMAYDLNGTQTANIEVERKSGMVISSKVNQDIKGTMTMSSESLPEDMTVPISMKTTMTMTCTEK